VVANKIHYSHDSEGLDIKKATFKRKRYTQRYILTMDIDKESTKKTIYVFKL
jgi:hypothetical protein